MNNQASRNSMLFATLVLMSWLFLIVLTAQNDKREWKDYQSEYNSILASFAPTPEGQEAIRAKSLQINQVFSKDIALVDRCITCHAGVEDIRFAETEQPFTTHPEINREAHPFSEFGCEICHEGQGRATTAKEAHGNVAHWGNPMLPRKYLQASCSKCHQEQELPGAEQWNAGRKLFIEQGCIGCHSAQGIINDTRIAPNLDGIGSKVSDPAWIFTWIRDPQNYLATAQMPGYEITAEQAASLALFLASLEEDLPPAPSFEDFAGQLPTEIPDRAGFLEFGRLRMEQAGCATCHMFDGVGGSIGGELGGIGSKVTLEWLAAWISNPQRFFPDTRMPDYRFSRLELAAVSNYIMQEFVDYELSEDAFSAFESLAAAGASADEGARLINTLGCVACHDLAGYSSETLFGPGLEDIGEKEPHALDFGLMEGEIPHTTIAWLEVKLRDSRAFNAQLKMPQYSLDEEELDQLMTFLLSQRQSRVPASWRAPPPPPGYEPLGLFGELANKYKCLTCHRINNVGSTLAPDLSVAGSMLKSNFIPGYMREADHIYPQRTEVMPKFGLNIEEAGIVRDYFRMVLVDEQLMENPLPDELTPGMIQLGESLFFEEYYCNMCHTMGAAVVEFGPDLTLIGDRLEPGYMFALILDPLRFNPESEMPVNENEDHSRAITAFLTTLTAGNRWDAEND